MKQNVFDIELEDGSHRVEIPSLGLAGEGPILSMACNKLVMELHKAGHYNIVLVPAEPDSVS